MAKINKTGVGRRGFLKGAAAGAAAGTIGFVASPRRLWRRSPMPAAALKGLPRRKRRAKTAARGPRLPARVIEHPGSDFMVDVFKSLGHRIMCCQPGSSFRGLHESLINYGGNTNAANCSPAATRNPPSRWRTATPRSKASRMMVADARHGRPAARRDGDLQRLVRPRARLHGGRQHADAAERGPGVEWYHSAQDLARPGPRLHQMGRPAVFARRTSRNPPCALTRSP